MNLLLDAHAFIWLDGDKQKLSDLAAAACSDTANTLWLSVVSLWDPN
jgi:PIN domain nuclease of toxin-antitoxin system